jgi:hypothetical protein
MEKLISELIRLYLLPDSPAAQGLAGRAAGAACTDVELALDGQTRTIALPFRKMAPADTGHWDRLCTVANGLQADFGFPAPAVSVAASGGFVLWLSLAVAVPLAQAHRFVDGLGRLWPDTLPSADAVGTVVPLPPCLDAATGKWAAFIHPGMGASFADESGLDMAPPVAGQAAFLEGLDSIAPDQFRAALDRLAPGPALPAASAPPATPASPPVAQPAPSAAGAGAGAYAEELLLKDATLDDIVRWLHARHIEPTFRYVLPLPRG